MLKLKTLLTHILFKTGIPKKIKAVYYGLSVLLLLVAAHTGEVQYYLSHVGLDKDVGTIKAADLLILALAYVSFVIIHRFRLSERKVIITPDDIVEAIANDKIEVILQPVYKLSTNTVTGFELLTRLHHPIYGVVTPFSHTTTIEDANPEAIKKLTAHIVDRAAEFYDKFKQEGYDFQMSIKLVAEDLTDGSVISTITKTLLNHRMPVDRLTVEISQSTLRGDLPSALKVIAGLDAIDVKICLDDYGMSVASFMHFKNFLIDGVKVDSSLTKRMDINQQNAEIVQAIVYTAHSAGTFVTAKHIETGAALNKAREVGCDFVQGYAVAPPMTFDQACAWLKTTRGHKHAG